MKNPVLKYSVRALWLLVLLELGLQLEWLPRHFFAHRLDDKNSELHIICLGESITAGYTQPLRNRLESEFPGRKIQITQLVKPSGLSNEIVDFFERYGMPLKPDVVISMMGISDDRKGRRLPEFLEEIGEPPSRIGLVRLWQNLRSQRLTEIYKEQMVREKYAWQAPETVDTRRIDNSTPVPRRLRASLELAAAGDREGALRLMEPVLAQAENTLPWSPLSSIYSWLQMKDETRRFLQKGLEPPGNTFRDLEKYYAAVDCALRVQAIDLAEAYLKKLKDDRIEDDASRTLLLKARLARMKGQYDQSLKFLNQIQLPERNGIVTQLQLEMATTLAFQGGGLMSPLWAQAGHQENFYNHRSQEAYRRLAELARKGNFRLLAMQYPLKPTSYLRAMLPNDPHIGYIDNEASFRQALQRSGYAEYFADVHHTGRAGHLTWAGAQLMVDNIIVALKPLLGSSRNR